ncbi:MAG TPA: TetR/AcrR family transcriptional regulator [Acidimicrobiales bacterium]|jgi:AcrR family transcriptional regulator|nr:TetR/AcrR family transcriptional regulator [Acidimicrobiales bacterium]
MTKGVEVPSRRDLRRERHHDLSRTQLLDAAERVFGEKGFYEATLNEIAELADYSVGSVYSFFEGKEDLFSQVFVRRGEEFMPAMRDIVEGTGSATDKLHRLVDFQVGFFRDHRRFARLFLRYANVALVAEPSELDASIAGNYDESMRLESGLISRGQRSGEFHPGDATVLAHLFSGLIASYQALDPSVVSDEPDPPERLSLVDLHQLVARAFEV